MKETTYVFEYKKEGISKEVVLSTNEDATLGEIRGLFYDWLACIGYQVQGNPDDLIEREDNFFV